MWFALGFVAACAFTAYILTSVWLLLVAAVLLCFAVLGRIFLPEGKARGIVLCVTVGVVIGLLWCQFYDYNNLQSARRLDGEVVNAKVTALDYSVKNGSTNTVECRWETEDSEHRILVYLQNDLQVLPGDQLKAEFTLRFTGLGGNRDATYHRGEGIALLAYPKDAVRRIAGENDFSAYFAANLRHGALETIGNIFPSDVSAFVKSLLLGHSEELSYETDSDLKYSGIRHVVAVSGLHISFLLGMVYFFVGRRSSVVFFISVPLLLVFAAVVGFTPSVVRACVMQLMLIVATWTEREYDPITALATATLVILFVNPQTVVSVGFQMSVGCVAGIVFFSGKILNAMEKISWIGTVKGNAWRFKVKRYILSTIAVSLSVTVFTVPLCAIYFGTVSLMAPLTNILCLWLISYLFVGGMLCCGLGAIFPVVGSAVAWVLSWGVRLVLWFAGGIAQIPFGTAYTQDENVIFWLVVSYLLLFLYFGIPRMRKKFLLWMIPVLYMVVVCASVISIRVDDYRLTVLDVGQGQCVLLQADGRTYMVDCGGTSREQTADTASAYLLSHGIFRLDGLILTHYDMDHVGGVPYLLERISVDKLYLPRDADEDFLQLIRDKVPQKPEYISRTEELQWEGNTISLYATDSGKSGNENSMCILFQTPECVILITGDRDQEGEKALLREYDIPNVDVLVVGHHGSASSTSRKLLRELKVQTAIISVGEGNRYGHPDDSVLHVLKHYGCEIYRTDLDGTIIIKG